MSRPGAPASVGVSPTRAASESSESSPSAARALTCLGAVSTDHTSGSGRSAVEAIGGAVEAIGGSAVEVPRRNLRQ